MKDKLQEVLQKQLTGKDLILFM